MTLSGWKLSVVAVAVLTVGVPAAAEECPGFGPWKFGGLDISETGDAVASLIAAAPACPATLDHHLTGECKVRDGIAYVVESEGAERRIDFKLRPVEPNERLPFGVGPSDTIDEVARKTLAANTKAQMYGFSSIAPDGRIVPNRRVSVEVLCDRGEGRSYFFGYWFDDNGRMTDVYADAFLSPASVYAPDVTFFTRRIEH